AIAEAGLSVLTGDNNADVDDSELELEEPAKRPLATWMDAARLHRPESRMLDVGVRSAHQTRLLRRSEMLPDLTLNMNLNAGYASSIDPPANYFMSRPTSVNGSLLLMLHTPIDWGVRYGRLE